MADSSGGAVKAGVLAALASVVASALLGWLTPFWGWVADVAASFWSHLGARSSWSNWTSYLLALIAAHSIVYWPVKWILARADNHTRFNQFSFLGARWRWVYTTSDLTAGLWAFCGTCDSSLVYEEVGSRYDPTDPPRVLLHCERCAEVRVSKEGDLKYLKSRVAREIDRLIRTGEWRQHVDAGSNQGHGRSPS